MAAWPIYLALPVAHAQPEAAPDYGNAANEPIEEIIVREDRSLRAMRIEVRESLEKIYELFNAYNSDDALDIHCSYEARVGSRVRERVCRGQYLDDATHVAGRDVVRSLQSSCPDGLTSCDLGDAETAFYNASFVFQREYSLIPSMDRRLEEELRRVGEEDADVTAAIAEYRAKEQAYRDAKERRRK